jgi:hypothetical protein
MQGFDFRRYRCRERPEPNHSAKIQAGTSFESRAMTLSTSQRVGIFAVLALVMMATRLHHFAAIPDASWAVFFIAGFYLRGSAKWAFPILMGLAVAIDVIVISHGGTGFWNHYCISPGYWVLAPAHLALWMGGSWFRGRSNELATSQLGWLVISLIVSASVAFVISNGSFYWASVQVASPDAAGWLKNLGDWYLPYLTTTANYVLIAALLHGITVLLVRNLAAYISKPFERG